MYKCPIKLTRCGHRFVVLFNAALRDVDCPKCGKRTAKPAWMIRLARLA